MPYQWIEDDGKLPVGVLRLGHGAPLPDGRYVMYHGTSRKAARSILTTGFRQSTDGMLGPGVYLSRELKKARRYPMNHPEHDKVVIRVVVNVGRVITIDHQDHPRQKTWHDPSYGEVFDTAWVPPNSGMTPSGLEEDCVWDPDQIEIINVVCPCQLEARDQIEGFLTRVAAAVGRFLAAFGDLVAAVDGLVRAILGVN